MQLAFYARAGHSVAWPGSAAPGQPRRLVGRTFVMATDKDAAKRSGVLGAFVADKEPAKVDSDGPDAPHLIRQCQKGGLWAADEATARACGVELAKLEQDADDEWVAATDTAPTSGNAGNAGPDLNAGGNAEDADAEDADAEDLDAEQGS